MIILREAAPAKINLTLHITGKRADGYHLLDSLVAFTEAGDVVEAVPAETLSLKIVGAETESLGGDDNSVMRAARALRRHAGVKAGAALTLHKSLPVASGIGGGSADAAAALRLLIRLWGIQIPGADLNKLALSLGADVPACLRSETLYMSGIGEEIAKGPDLRKMPMLLVNPNKPLATAEVFRSFRSGFSEALRHPAEFASQRACVDYLKKGRNDLEPPACGLLSEITHMLAAIRAQEGCELARMSGSGATCFGIFEDTESAGKAAGRLADEHRGWWVKHTSARS